MSKQPQEPKWKNSEARRILYGYLQDGLVPRTALDQDGRSTMKLIDIYNLHPEFKKHEYSMFSSRLSSLRRTFNNHESRAVADERALEDFCSRRLPSLTSKKGYGQWQGSEAQKALLQDIEEGKNNIMSMQQLYFSRPVYYENFPQKAFSSNSQLTWIF